MNFAIFLSPSENKNLVVNDTLPHQDIIQQTNINTHNMQWLDELWGDTTIKNHRKITNELYKETLKQILKTHDTTLLLDIFGVKTLLPKYELEINFAYQQNAVMMAIERYCGVAFEGLDFTSLNIEAKEFILQHVFLFSNLFGVIQANNKIPFYKLKQGAKTQSLRLKDIYQPFIANLDSFTQSLEFIVDLRSGVYTKIFMPKQKHFFFEFSKNAKSISHYAKLYRGKILRSIALAHKLWLSSDFSFEIALDFFQTLKDENMQFDSLRIQNNTIILHYTIL